ncbi:MAG: hypothetical protein JO040_00080 [Gemmatimonadetes bacterium]|nr:hypothetical protein [Gemmatimonadota bacterium]
MTHGTDPVPLALLTLPGHHDAPARAELVYLPASWRLPRAMGALLFFWGILPLVVWVPPHYPWVLACFATGLYLAYSYWTGRYRVRAFTGSCPRCERELSLAPGSRIALPHTLTCFACHFEPQLCVTTVAATGGVEHRDADCVGRWGMRWLADEPYLVCDTCRSHRPATPEACLAAEAENDRGVLLARLTVEGDFLP